MHAIASNNSAAATLQEAHCRRKGAAAQPNLLRSNLPGSDLLLLPYLAAVSLVATGVLGMASAVPKAPRSLAIEPARLRQLRVLLPPTKEPDLDRPVRQGPDSALQRPILSSPRALWLRNLIQLQYQMGVLRPPTDPTPPACPSIFAKRSTESDSQANILHLVPLLGADGYFPPKVRCAQVKLWHSSEPELVGRSERRPLRQLRRGHLEEVKTCLEGERIPLPTSPIFAALHLALGPSGKVVNSTLQSSELLSLATHMCLEAASEHWRYRPQNRMLSIVSFYLAFQVTGSCQQHPATVPGMRGDRGSGARNDIEDVLDLPLENCLRPVRGPTL